MQIKTMGGVFSLDLDKFKNQIETDFDLRITKAFSQPIKGFVNVNLPISTTKGKKIIRVFGSYDDFTLQEIATMQYLNQNGSPSAHIVNGINRESIHTFENYHYAIFDFIQGVHPPHTEDAFYRVGIAVAKMQRTLEHLSQPPQRDNRFFITLKMKDSMKALFIKHKDLISQLFNSEDITAIEKQLLLFEEITFNDDDTIIPIHSDIYDNNLIDTGKDIYILDFEYIGNGPKSIDTFSYIAWHAVNDQGIKEKEIKSYLEGYKSIDKNFNPSGSFKTLVFLNIVDSIYNFEKALTAEENQFTLYRQNLKNTETLLNNKEKIEKILHSV